MGTSNPSPPARAPEPRSTLKKFRSYAAAATTSPIYNKALGFPITRRKLVLRKPNNTAKTKAKVSEGTAAVIVVERVINHLGVLSTGELLNSIMMFFRGDASVLRKMMNVNKDFAAAAAYLVWERRDRQDLITFVKSQQRRQHYASLITQESIWSHEKLWKDDSTLCPIFSRIATLELYDTALRSGPANAIIPFLSPQLKHFAIYTEDEYPAVIPEVTRCDDAWLAHMAVTCNQLDSLTLDIVLDVGSFELAKFFQKIQQLRVLHLGEEMNHTLNDSALLGIFTLPCLEVLSLPFEVEHRIMRTLNARSKDYPILPSIQKLQVRLVDGAGLDAKWLLHNLHTLKNLQIDIGNSDGQERMHKDVFNTISSLQNLQSLLIRLEPGMHVSGEDLFGLSGLPNLQALEISVIPRGFMNCNNDLRVSGSCFCDAMANFKKLEYLTLDLDRDWKSPMVMTVGQVTLLNHLLSNYSHCSIGDLGIEVDEASSFGWPTLDDWENWIGVPDDVWLAKNTDSGDTRQWVSRNLRFGVTVPETNEDEAGSDYDWQGDLRSEVGDEFDE